ARPLLRCRAYLQRTGGTNLSEHLSRLVTAKENRMYDMYDITKTKTKTGWQVWFQRGTPIED
ncbi:hypothetical protein, partial [Thiolapillus sp.]